VSSEESAARALGNELRALREVLRSPDLGRLELAWLATSIGTWGGALVLAVYAYDVGGAAAVGLMGMFRTLPGAPVAPLLALVADRYPRRSVLLATNGLRAMTMAGTAIAVAADAGIGAVYALAALLAVVGPSYRPAQAALFPLLARTPSELASANVAASMLVNIGFLVGSLAGGALLTVTSAASVLGGVAAMFAISLVLLAGITPDRRPRIETDARPGAEISEGFRVVRDHPEVRELVSVLSALTLVEGAIDALVVVAALSFLDIGESGAGYLWAAWGAGAICGGAFALGLLSRNRLTLGLTAGSIALGGAIALTGIVSAAALAAATLAGAGGGYVLVEIAANTLLQRLAPDHILARVFGVVETLYLVSVGVGAAAAALLVDLLGVRGALVAVGALMPVMILLRRSRLSRLEAGAPVPGREYGLLRHNRIFAPLPVATTERLARNLIEVRPRDGAEVISQDDVGDRYYLIAEGQLDAFENGVYQGTMVPGEGFGEIALLREIPRTATVRAHAGAVLLALEREAFIEAVTGLPHSRLAAESLADERLGDDPVRPSSPPIAN
jgi:MFS family permease